MENLTKFTANSNPFWTILADANDLHRSAAYKYLQLMDLLKEKGVQFSDIRNYLMNESKRSGLWRKTLYNPSKGMMDYPPKASLKHLSWYRTLVNFMSWVSNNFEAYGVEKGKPKREKTKVVAEVVVRRGVIEVPKEAPLSAPPKTAPSVTGEVFNTSDVKLEKPLPQTTGTKAPAAADVKVAEDTHKSMIAPVTQELSSLQKAQIVFQNLEILGQKAIESGAGNEFNALMLAMGLENEVIMFD